MKYLVKTSALAAISLLLSTPAFSDPSMECSSTNGSQVEIGACVSQAAEAVDQALTDALGFARDSAKELDEVTGRSVSEKALDEGQSAWAAYRDAHCEFVGSTYGGGSGTGIAITSCRIELGRERVTTLMSLVN